MSSLTKKHYDAMSEIRDGADVYVYGIAVLLREVQAEAPELITICAAKNPPSGEKQQPYFGAVLTEKGLKAIQ